MTKILFFIAMLISTANTQNIHFKKNYKITYGSFLDLAELNATISIIDGKYIIKSKSRAIGSIGFFNKKITEYISRGKYKEKKFTPYLFIKKETNGDIKTTKEARFNHKTKTVTGVTKIFELEDDYFVIKEKKDVNISNGMSNDVVSLLFNLPYYANKYSIGDKFKIRAIDASDEDGFFYIKNPTKKEIKLAKELLNTNINNIAIIYIDEPIFSTDVGKLVLAIGKDGVFTKAILKDLSFFGNVLLEEVKPN